MKTTKHQEITLRPPPGVRFSVWGADVRLQFEIGREEEIVNWLRNWIDTQIVPEMKFHKARAAAIEARKAEVKTEVQATSLLPSNTPAQPLPSPNQIRMSGAGEDRCGFVRTGKQCQLGVGHLPVNQHVINGQQVTVNSDGTITDAVSTKEQ